MSELVLGKAEERGEILLKKTKELGANGEYRWGGTGQDTNRNGKPEYDCAGLVTAALRKLGYCLPKRLTSDTIRSNSDGLFAPVKDKSQLKKGDILVIKTPAGQWHTVIVESYDPKTGTGEFYGANSRRSGIGHQRFGPGTYWNGYFEAFRLKKPPAGAEQPVCMWPSGIHTLATHFFNSMIIQAMPTRKDPLILDLNGDGIGTMSVGDGLFFDANGDGFAEQMGWIDSDDGFLVLDRNGDGNINDGTELFGDQMLLNNGTKASNGLQALAQLDSNADGKIDRLDEAYSQLRVWNPSEGHDLAGLHSLTDLGITSISLHSASDSGVDAQGNTRIAVGSFEWTDGTTGRMAEYDLERDTTSTIATEWLDVPDDIAALPDLQGFGIVYDLHQAMVRDATGQLKSLVEQFICASDSSTLDSLMEQILFQWTGTERLPQETSLPSAPSAMYTDGNSTDAVLPMGGMYNPTGNYIDERKIAVLEHFFGVPWVGDDGPTPNYAASIHLNAVYRKMFEMTRAELMARTRLKDLYDQLSYTWDEERQEGKTNFSNVIPALVSSLDANPQHGKELLSEFAGTLRGISSCSPGCYLTFREHMIEIDPEFGWVFDTGGLPVYDQLGQSPDGWSHSHMFGTWGSDAVKGSLTAGDGYINALSGNDVVYGTERNERLYNQDGDALLYGGGGNDIIWAGAGNDILDGGTGNDILYGETGNDTYIFRRDSGQDIIVDADATPGNVDTIFLGSSLTPEEIVLRRAGNNLVLRIIGASDTMTVKDFFRTDSTLNRVEQIQFMDGTVWTEADMIAKAYGPSEDDDMIYGTTADDSLVGLGGNDQIFARAGDDIVDGGTGSDRLYGEAGNDTLLGGDGSDTLVGGDGDDILSGGAGHDIMDGGSGSDTYRFARGAGQDTIVDPDTTAGEADVLSLDEGVLPEDVKLQRIENDLKLTIRDAGDSVTARIWPKTTVRPPASRSSDSAMARNGIKVG